MSLAAVSLIASIAVAVFSSVTAPLILAYRTQKLHNADRAADYARQDAKDALAAKEKSLLELKQVNVEAAEVAERHAVDAEVKLDRIDAETDRIHTLVNSDMTAAQQEALDQCSVTIAVLRRVIVAARTAGEMPDPADVAALEHAETRRGQLQQIIAEREEQLRLAEEQADQSGAGRQLNAEAAETDRLKQEPPDEQPSA